MKRIKWLALMLVAVIALSAVLAGCGGSSADNDETVGDAQSNQQTEGQKDTEKEDTGGYDGPKVVDYYLSAEPQTLDPQQMYGQPDMVMANMFMEGLLRAGKEEGEVIPGVAESYEFDEETNTYTFKLNPNAKWADGKQVTADDFFFAWRLAMDTTAPYYNFFTDYIEGAQEYANYDEKVYLAEKDEEFKGMLDQLAELNEDPEGNKAAIEELQGKIDARIEAMTDDEKAEYEAKKEELWNNVKIGTNDDGSEIYITLKVPAPYFPNLVAFPVYYPVNRDFYEEHMAAGDYFKEASGLPSNGPWKVVEWKHNDYFKLVRNENYWNNDNINIDELNIKIVNDVATRTNLLKTGEIDGSAIQAADLKEFEDMATLNQYNLQPLVNKPDFSSFYVAINYNYEGEAGEALRNANIRKALAYALDRQSYVEKISLGDKPALAFIPYEFPGYEKSFREEAGEELFEDNNKEKAKEFLEKGLEELGMTVDQLNFKMMIGESDIAKKSAEKIQADWAEIGINLELESLPWSEQLSRLQSGDYMMSNSGWGPDYPDPMTFLEIFKSDSPNNTSGYSNPKYDELLEKAMVEEDPKARMEYLYEAERILIQEDMAIIPNYFRIAHWTYKEYLTGVVNRGVGATTDFYFADIDMEAKLADKN